MLKTIKLTELKENPIALRSVNKQSEAYLELVESIREKGILETVLVREKKDEDSGAAYYELINGLQRTTAARDLGLETIDVNVQNMDDAAALEAQIVTNIQRIETKPAEYTKQLRRILNMNPTMTEGELARKLGKSRQWIEMRLSLNKISNPEILKLINDNDITLVNAYALASLPEDEQTNYIEGAMTEPAEKFVAKVKERVKEIKDARNKGQKAGPAQFTPVEHLQKVRDIRDARNPDSPIIKAVIVDMGIKDPIKAAVAILNWVLNADPVSVAVQKEEYDRKQAEKKAKAEKRAAEKAARAAEKEAEAKDAEGKV